MPSAPCHLHQYHLFSLQIPAAPTEKDKGMLLGKRRYSSASAWYASALACSVHHLSCYLDTAWYHMLQELCYKGCVKRGVLKGVCYKGCVRTRGYENTRDENHRQRVATRLISWLSSASRRIKPTSPPGHHSSDPSPPKLLEETEGRRLEVLRLPQGAEGTRALESTRPLEPTARPLPSLNFLALA